MTGVQTCALPILSLVVVISRQAETISSGDQCACLMRYRISFSDVSELSWLDGLETRAQNAASSCVFPTSSKLSGCE